MKGDFYERVVSPALLPLGAFLFIGLLVYAVSRILLAVTTEGSVVVATLMAACILFGAGAVAKSGTMKGVQKVALVAFSLILFGSGIAVEASLGPREVEKHLNVVDSLVAQNLTFDKTTLTIPADEGFIIELDNKDSQPHNVAIYATREDGVAQRNALFDNEPFAGPAVRELQDEDGIPAGLYYFQCDVHIQMNGTARAGQGGATPAPGGTPTQGPSPGGTTGPAPTSPSPSPSPS